MGILIPMILAEGCASQGVAPYRDTQVPSNSVQTIPYRVGDRIYYPMTRSAGFVQQGTASWYGPDFHGKLTSNGEVYNMNSLTAAHKTLPFGSVVRVTHQVTGKSVVVRINDRGPFVNDRVIDLSYDAAEELGMIETGTAPVNLRVIRGAQAVPPRDASGQSASRDLFSVQVGVFENRENAARVSQRFPDSRILPVSSEGRMVYKVLVGKYSNYRNALEPMDRMRLQGIPGAFIVLSP